MFLGTPHSGSGFAPAAAALAKWIGLLKQTNPDIVRVLKTDSEVLARIQAGFLSLVRSREKHPHQAIDITCFYEELPLKGVGEVCNVLFSDLHILFLHGLILFGQVVPFNSAIILGYTSVGIHSNHMGMARFENEDDPGFVSVSGELRRWVKKLTDPQTTINTSATNKNSAGAWDGSNTIPARPSRTVTHNGNNTGEARVVYGGTMTNSS